MSTSDVIAVPDTQMRQQGSELESNDNTEDELTRDSGKPNKCFHGMACIIFCLASISVMLNTGFDDSTPCGSQNTSGCGGQSKQQNVNITGILYKQWHKNVCRRI